VAATTGLQLPVEINFPGQPFLLYFVAVVASASVLGRTAGFVAVAETSIASLLFYDPAYSLKVTHTVDLLAIEIYAIVAALTVEAFCRLIDSALAEKSAAISARMEAEARLADREVQLKLTRNSEARFRATFDTAAVGVAHIAPDGRWLRVNDALCRTLGYPANELLTKSFQDVTCPDDLAADLVQIELMREGKIDSYNIEKRYVRKDGAIIWAKKTVSCVRKGDGSIDYFVGVIEDISASNRPRRNYARMRNASGLRSSTLHCPCSCSMTESKSLLLAKVGLNKAAI
jgi:PAS domain S-box-containing protein